MKAKNESRFHPTQEKDKWAVVTLEEFLLALTLKITIVGVNESSLINSC